MQTNHSPAPRAGRRGRLALGALLPALVPALTVAQPATGPAEEAEELASFEVTGTRIRRVDIEGPNPVVSFGRTEIARTGYTSVGELVRNLPIANGQGQDSQSVLGFGAGANVVNLRGLGVGNTLVLINGRRTAPIGAAVFDGFSAAVDLNSIPEAAIERVEILKDGGSAIYGSDAVAGVINIITRQNYDGLTGSFEFGNTTGTDSALKKGSLVVGGTGDRFTSVLAIDWSDRNSLMQRDYDYTSDADSTRFGGQDNGSFASMPANVFLPGGNAAGLPEDYYTLYGGPTTTPPVGAFSPLFDGAPDGSLNLFNFNEYQDLRPAEQNYGVYGRFTYELTAKVEAFAEVTYRKTRAVLLSAPPPVFSFEENGSGPNGEIIIPATNPYNPFGTDIEEFYLRLTDLGSRRSDVESETPRLVAGLEGEIGDTSWTWQAAALYAESKRTEIASNYATDAAVQAALAQTDPALALNPFGPSNPEVIDGLRVVLNSSGLSELSSYEASATGELFELPAGAVSLAVGGEYREEYFEDNPDAFANTGGVIAQGGAAGLDGRRSVYSAYGEVIVPIVRGLEAQLAGRFEHYSDFGDATKPKIALSWRPSPAWLVRASFSQSFKAPTLQQLYTGESVSFTSSQYSDPLRPADTPRQLRVLSGGNRELQPEETDIYYAGVVYEVPVVRGLSLGLDVYRYAATDLISVQDINFILDQETTNPTGLVVRNPPQAGQPGTINGILQTFQNVARQDYEGVDFSVEYTSPTTSLGRFTYDLTATYLHTFEFDGSELADTWSYPEWRGSSSIGWQRGNWSAVLYASYIAGYDDDGDFSAGEDLYRRVGHDIRFNPQITYSGLWDTDITLGATNVFDREAPLAFGTSDNYNNSVSNGEGRYVYVRVSREF